MNTTLIAASLADCETILSSVYVDQVYWDMPSNIVPPDPLLSQTAIGCKVLHLLQEMYKFNISYFYEDAEIAMNTIVDEGSLVSSHHNRSIDIFVRPLSCRSELLDHLYPLQGVYTWRIGFLLRRYDYVGFYRTFYSKPFTRPAWNCLYGMALIFALIFYFLKRWEKRILGGLDSSFSYEALMVIGGYCQHIPPLDATMPSRRTTYFVFFIFAYIIYTYYTSNLLSHLVNDKDHSMNLYELAESDYKFVMVDYMKAAIEGAFVAYNRNYSIMVKKLNGMPSVTAPAGIAAVRSGSTAILSEYTNLYPLIKKTFDNDEICKLIQIDLYSNIKKYFFTSKYFPYKEQFKIGTLRAQETGVLSRLVSNTLDVPQCAELQMIQAGFIQISTPLTILFCTYVLSIFILVAERIHYKRNRIWPYVE